MSAATQAAPPEADGLCVTYQPPTDPAAVSARPSHIVVQYHQADALFLDRISSPLASNNPFRNRVDSTSPIEGNASARPISTNPFLDSSEVAAEPTTNGRPSSKKGATETTTELMSDLNISGKMRSPERRPGPPMMNGGPRRENIPPRPYGRGPPPGHRPTPSEEERRRREAKMRAQKGELDIFADPAETARLREKRGPRRNSESSIRDKPNNLDTEEEKKRRERKYRESKHSKGPKKPSKRLDLIDRLDVTSIYGTGLFHHDGPFDACNPHRNRKGAKAAPMQAFPEGSLNMQLGGSGPVKKNIDLEQYHGRGQEAHGDYNEAAVVDEDAEYFRRPQPERSGSFNPMLRTEPVHGSETAGLGTSTFLEGAPASRVAIERRENEVEQQQQQALQQGLSRKKSLAQRIRGTRSNTIGNRPTSPEIMTPTTPLETGKSESNTNPFFKDYDQEYEKKGAQIAFAQEEQNKTGRARAPSSPRRELPLSLSRTKTADSIVAAGSTEEGKSSGSGFLSRVKSLKGGRKARPERRDTSG